MRESLAAYFKHISRVLSVEALSEIISSKFEYVWHKREFSVSARYFSPLKTGKPILTEDLLLLIVHPFICNFPTLSIVITYGQEISVIMLNNRNLFFTFFQPYHFKNI